jgi:hypothetical protein
MGNETPGVDYSAVLADLEARKAQIESAIAVITALVKGGMPPSATPGVSVGSVPPPNPPNGVEILSDTFFGLSILDATKKFLAMRKRPSSGAEVVAALRAGGQINAQNDTFGNTLGATLSRSDAGSGSVVRVGRGKYGLREWYANKPKETE